MALSATTLSHLAFVKPSSETLAIMRLALYPNIATVITLRISHANFIRFFNSLTPSLAVADAPVIHPIAPISPSKKLRILLLVNKSSKAFFNFSTIAAELLFFTANSLFRELASSIAFLERFNASENASVLLAAAPTAFCTSKELIFNESKIFIACVPSTPFIPLANRKKNSSGFSL